MEIPNSKANVGPHAKDPRKGLGSNAIQTRALYVEVCWFGWGSEEEPRIPPEYLTPRRPIAHADTDLTPSFSCANPNKTLQILLINLFYLIIIIYTVSEVTVFSLLYRDQKQRERLINDFLFHLFIYFTRKKKIERDNPKGQKEWERIERRDIWYFSLSLSVLSLTLFLTFKISLLTSSSHQRLFIKTKQ